MALCSFSGSDAAGYRVMQDDVSQIRVPGYFTFDLGVVWRYDGLTVSVMGKDLAEERHQEFAKPPNLQAIPRSITGRIAWRV